MGLPDFANRFELPDELPEPILITEEEAQQKLQELGVRSHIRSSVSLLTYFFF